MMHSTGAAGLIPVTILTGFLGSGKTTLLNYILTEKHGMRIAVIENEFGEVDVDSDLVLASDEEIFQMTNGCICCVVDVRKDLVRILQALLARPEQFDHIIVETSGLADPTPVAATFFMDNDVAHRLRLDGVVTLVDALHIERHLDDPELEGVDNQAVDQIVAADRIIINKTDLVEPDALPALEQRMRRINQGAQVLRSSHAQVDLNLILGIGGFDSGAALIDPHFLDEHHEHEHGHECSESCGHGTAASAAPAASAGSAANAPEGVCGLPGNGGDGRGHAHDPSVESVSLTFSAPFDRRQLDAWLAQLLDAQGDDLFRLKGIIAIAGDSRRHVLQGVHRVLDLRPADAWPHGLPQLSKLVFIGRNLDRDTLKAGLDWCLAMPQQQLSPPQLQEA
jgi:G3E family GTPase